MNSDASDINSYWLDADEFGEVFSEITVDDPQLMPDIVEALDESYLGISSFYIENSGMTSWTGTKAQPLPAAGWENKFRFESGNSARGYIYY